MTFLCKQKNYYVVHGVFPLLHDPFCVLVAVLQLSNIFVLLLFFKIMFFCQDFHVSDDEAADKEGDIKDLEFRLSNDLSQLQVYIRLYSFMYPGHEWWGYVKSGLYTNRYAFCNICRPSYSRIDFILSDKMIDFSSSCVYCFLWYLNL